MRWSWIRNIIAIFRMEHANIKNVIKRINARLASGTYKKNKNAYKQNKSALTRKKSKSKNDTAKLKMANYLEKMKIQSLPEKITEAELDDDEEEAEIAVGVCSTGDTYTPDILKEQYKSHTDYVKLRKDSATRLKILVRLPHIPEDISENMIKFIIRNWVGDKTSTWSCKSGDLHSDIEGTQECKCFTSDGPLSFSPSTTWNVIYFLDARKWLDNKYVLYRVNLMKTSEKWQGLLMSKTQTFGQQMKQGRRPRISWKNLAPQIEGDYTKVFEGNFDDIFTPPPKINMPRLTEDKPEEEPETETKNNLNNLTAQLNALKVTAKAEEPSARQ